MRPLITLWLLLCLACAQTPTITNHDILEMTKAGLSPIVIVDKIKASSCKFETSTADLTQLKSAGVGDAVLSAMINCHPAMLPHDKPHVWVGANEEWIAYENRLTTASSNSSGTSAFEVSASKTTAQTHSEYPDVTKELVAKCPELVVTNDPADADYAIAIERYHAGHVLTQRNSFSIFRAQDGHLVLSNTTTWLKNAAKDMCQSMLQDRTSKKVSLEKK